jgi:hypothetical protein
MVLDHMNYETVDPESLFRLLKSVPLEMSNFFGLKAEDLESSKRTTKKWGGGGGARSKRSNMVTPCCLSERVCARTRTMGDFETL